MSKRPETLKRFIRLAERRFKLRSPLKAYGGPVILGPPPASDMLYKNNIVVVGDAGGLTKPLTGGGLFPNALLARLLEE